MTFLKWFIVTNLFHVLMIILAFVIMSYWPDELDRVFGTTFFICLSLILIVGKYIYYKNNQSAIDEKFK